MKVSSHSRPGIFSVVQNNLTYINEGNIDAFQARGRREAYTSHGTKGPATVPRVEEFALVKSPINVQKLTVDMNT